MAEAPVQKTKESRHFYTILFGVFLLWHVVGAAALLALVGTMGTSISYTSPYNMLLLGGSSLVWQWTIFDAPLLFIAAALYFCLLLALFLRKPAVAVLIYLISCTALIMNVIASFAVLLDEYFWQSVTVFSVIGLFLLPVLALLSATYPLIHIWKKR